MPKLTSLLAVIVMSPIWWRLKLCTISIYAIVGPFLMLSTRTPVYSDNMLI